MFSREQWLNIIGAIASIFGFAATIILALYNCAEAALLMFTVTMVICVFVWMYYARKKQSTTHPYIREYILNQQRYIFDSPTVMTYEVLDTFQVTTPILTSVPINLAWSGQGKVGSVESELLSSKIIPHVDGHTGKITFMYPLSEPKRFGDVVTVHYRIHLEDTSGKNKPQLSLRTKSPCRFLLFEVFLRHRASCGPATFSWTDLTDSTLAAPHEDSCVQFDPLTRSFRKLLAAPCVGRQYKMTWPGEP